MRELFNVVNGKRGEQRQKMDRAPEPEVQAMTCPEKKTRAKTTSLGRRLVVRRPTSLGSFPLYQCCVSRSIALRLLGIDQEGLS